MWGSEFVDLKASFSNPEKTCFSSIAWFQSSVKTPWISLFPSNDGQTLPFMCYQAESILFRRSNSADENSSRDRKWLQIKSSNCMAMDVFWNNCNIMYVMQQHSRKGILAIPASLRRERKGRSVIWVICIYKYLAVTPRQSVWHVFQGIVYSI